MACFHAAYTPLELPTGGLIFGYALALVQLSRQPTVRRAFYFGLAAGFLSYAPQLWFFFKIFNLAAVLLWLVLAFWVGLFTAMVCGGTRRWGRTWTPWLIPVVWTGIEYFRSEWYLLKFSWLNIGYALPWGSAWLGMYGAGFLALTLAAIAAHWKTIRPAPVLSLLLAGVLAGGLALHHLRPATRTPAAPLALAGVQMEFPSEPVIPKLLTHALAQNPAAQIFVLSEYTLDGPVPDTLKKWCREHARYLVVGGKDPAGADNYFNTAFVVGPNGDIVFQQAKSVPIQFFRDGRPALRQAVWDSPWGKIGFCVCYDLSYTRVIDELVRQDAQLLIVPTMDVEDWSRHEHELHARVAPVRAAEYGLPIFRLSSSGISQAVDQNGRVLAQTPMPGNGALLTANLDLSPRGARPVDRWAAPACTAVTAMILALLLWRAWREARKRKSDRG